MFPSYFSFITAGFACRRGSGAGDGGGGEGEGEGRPGSKAAARLPGLGACGRSPAGTSRSLRPTGPAASISSSSGSTAPSVESRREAVEEA